jgi:5'-deoxynucleotidase YfbR-like HD superfamily hydrolase
MHCLIHDIAEMVKRDMKDAKISKKVRRKIVRKILEMGHPKEWSRVQKGALESDFYKIIDAYLG